MKNVAEPRFKYWYAFMRKVLLLHFSSSHPLIQLPDVTQLPEDQDSSSRSSQSTLLPKLTNEVITEQYRRVPFQP